MGTNLNIKKVWNRKPLSSPPVKMENEAVVNFLIENGVKIN